MAFRNDITVDWTLSPRIIEVAAPSTDVDIQDLYDTLRELEQRTQNLIHQSIVSAGGKEELGGGTLVGVTLTLINAKLKFEDRVTNTVASVTGGNLVAIDENGDFIDPLEFSANVNAFIAQSSSATISSQQLQQATQFLIESLRPTHGAFGDVYYWDPVNGNDNQPGTLPNTAVKTFAKAHDLVTDGKSDVIFIVDETGQTFTVTETLNITKNAVNVRGNGAVIFAPTSGYAIDITGDLCSVSGFFVRSLTGNAGVRISDNSGARLEDFRVTVSLSNGVEIINGIGHNIINCSISNCSGSGIYVEGSTATTIDRGRIFDNLWGIELVTNTTADTENTTIRDIIIDSNTTGGIDIGSGVVETAILQDNFINNPIQVQDNGTGTQYAEIVQRGRTVDATLDEQLSGHATVGSVGAAIADSRAASIVADATVLSGSTVSEIRTNLTEADNFYDGLTMQIISGSSIVARKILQYSNINGAFTPIDDLPFTPQNGDRIIIISDHSIGGGLG